MRTCFLIHGVSWSELPEGPWREEPWTDNGRILFERDDPATVDNLYHEGAAIAQIDSFGVLLRGRHNPNDSWLPLLRHTAEAHPYPFLEHGLAAPTFFPFFDTGSLPDLGGGEFDLADDRHHEIVWREVFEPFLETFDERRITSPHNPVCLERTRDGRIVVLLWSIDLPGVVNHYGANALLRALEANFHACRYAPAFIVDQSWLRHVPSLQIYAAHDWFAPPWSSYSIRTHRGMRCGVAVPGFHDPDHVPEAEQRVVPRENGDTLRTALAAFRRERCDYVFLESLTNAPESAGFYRSPLWDDLYLSIVRDHVQQTRRDEPADRALLSWSTT